MFTQVQLYEDPQDPSLYQNVLVDRRKLSHAVLTASQSSTPAFALLNSVIDLVFTFDELASAQGMGLRKSQSAKKVNFLDRTKVQAIKGKII